MPRPAPRLFTMLALLGLTPIGALAQSAESETPADGPQTSAEASTDTIPIMTVCREGTWLNRQPFNGETVAQGHESWPESARALDPENFTDPSFRSIPTPTDYIVVEETLEGFRTEAEIIRDNVTIKVRMLSPGPGEIRFQQLSAQHANGQYLGMRGGNVYWRPSDNLAANTLTVRTLDALLENRKPLQFEDADADLRTRFPTEPLLRAFEHAEDLCRQADDNETTSES